MSDAQKAYKAAEQRIAEAREREDGASEISFNTVDCRALTRIPPEIADLTALTDVDLDTTSIADLAPLSPLTGLLRLVLNQTGVTDLTPLSALTGLKILSLAETGVTDLAPLEALTGLQDLYLHGTKVIDLRPLRDLDRLGTNRPPGLAFRDTPATAHDAELARLARINDTKDRAEQTRAYLHTLPPWPDPLPWEDKTRDTGNGPGAKAEIAQTQIAFLLDHAAVSQVTAETTASQIRHALRDINDRPPVLKTMGDVADVLDRLAKAPIGPGNPEREAELTARIAELEAQVQTLTAQLADAKAAREAAEALAGAPGFWSKYKSAAGTPAGAGTVALAGITAPTALVYFLGADHPLIQAFLTVTGRLPR